MREIRRQCPRCEHTDDELETLIATEAIAMRLNVALDRPYFVGWLRIGKAPV
jgi:hypothetical protein